MADRAATEEALQVAEHTSVKSLSASMASAKQLPESQGKACTAMSLLGAATKNKGVFSRSSLMQQH